MDLRSGKPKKNAVRLAVKAMQKKIKKGKVQLLRLRWRTWGELENGTEGWFHGNGHAVLVTGQVTTKSLRFKNKSKKEVKKLLKKYYIFRLYDPNFNDSNSYLYIGKKGKAKNMVVVEGHSAGDVSRMALNANFSKYDYLL